MNKLFHFVASLLGFGGIRAGAIMDAKLEFSDAQTIAMAGPLGGTEQHVDATNIVYFGDAYVGAAVGRGTPVILNVVVNTAFNGAAASTFKVYLQTSADGTTWSSGLLFASRTSSQCATIGAVIVQAALPAHDLTKYLTLVYSGSGMSSGYVNAWLDLNGQTMPLDTTTYGWNG